ncbi:MAG: hypothetical protein AB7O48_06330 [Cyclobacteriaceae bacterium]
MKKLISVAVLGIILISCQESESVSEFTGNEVVYALQQGSSFNVSGQVIISEKKDGSAVIEIQLDGTDGDVQLPAHLHLGDISTPGADVAALLTPVDGVTGKSKTNLLRLADETSVSYKDLIDLEACIKVHLSDIGPERDIVLAGGNIGAIATKDATNGRIGIGVCKSE